MKCSFCLIGTNQPIIVELDIGGMHDLADHMCQSRYIAGDLVTHNGELLRVLIPVARVNLVSEVGA